jgi:hypothetical protein
MALQDLGERHRTLFAKPRSPVGSGLSLRDQAVPSQRSANGKTRVAESVFVRPDGGAGPRRAARHAVQDAGRGAPDGTGFAWLLHDSGREQDGRCRSLDGYSLRATAPGPGGL